MREIRVLAMLEAHSVSGSAKAVLEFAKEAAHGHPGLPKIGLSILTFDRGQGANSLTRAVRDIGAPLDIVFERRRFDSNVIPQLRAAVKNRRADVIWSNSVKSHFLVRLAGLNRSCRWVAFHHGYTTTDIKMRIYNRLDLWSLRAADRVLTVCRPFAEQLQRRGVQPNRIQIQHMPIRPFPAVSSEEIREVRNKLDLDSASRLLLSIGRLSKEKGHVDLVRAFARLREQKSLGSLRLALVGEGPERERIMKLCHQFGLEKVVTLTGHLDNVAPYYAIANLFVLPSHTEGSPNVLIEAMAAGVPVVATSVGGVPELARHERDAILTPKRNVPALAAGIARVLGDDSLHRRLKSAGLEILSRNTPREYYRSVVLALDEGACERQSACGTETINATGETA
jgi:glycosyltransferase involved in cell wall biosynthesis